LKFWQRYSEVSAIMKIAFGVPKANQKSFEARLGYLRRPEIGCVPMAIQGGKNKLTFYNESALRQIFLAMVLNFQLGMDPKHIGKLYQIKRSRVNPKSDETELVPSFNLDEWFAEGEQRIPEGLLDSMKLQKAYGPSVTKKYEPYIVMFRATPGFENKNQFAIKSRWEGANLNRIMEGDYSSPCSTFLDFTYLAAWLKLAIREWERALQGE